MASTTDLTLSISSMRSRERSSKKETRTPGMFERSLFLKRSTRHAVTRTRMGEKAHDRPRTARNSERTFMREKGERKLVKGGSSKSPNREKYGQRGFSNEDTYNLTSHIPTIYTCRYPDSRWSSSKGSVCYVPSAYSSMTDRGLVYTPSGVYWMSEKLRSPVSN